MFHLEMLDMTTIVVALLSSGAVASILTVFLTRRDRLSHAYTELTAAQSNMQAEIDAQDKKLAKLFDENDVLRRTLHAYEDKDLERTRYIRGLYHWMDGLCQEEGLAYVRTHPKPSLPDSMRADFPRFGQQ
jgi:cell shape-determining protein MreC